MAIGEGPYVGHIPQRPYISEIVARDAPTPTEQNLVGRIEQTLRNLHQIRGMLLEMNAPVPKAAASDQEPDPVGCVEAAAQALRLSYEVLEIVRQLSMTVGRL